MTNALIFFAGMAYGALVACIVVIYSNCKSQPEEEALSPVASVIDFDSDFYHLQQ